MVGKPVVLPDRTMVEEEDYPIKPKGFLDKIKEKIFRESGTEPVQVINPALFGYWGERPAVDFKTCIYYFERTPQLQTAVFNYLDRIFGTEITINADDESAKKIIDDWNYKTDAFSKYKAVGTTTLICGAALLEKLDEKTIQDIKPVRMSSIVGKHRDPFGLIVEYYTQLMNDGTVNKIGVGLPDARKRFVEFHLTNYDENDWGRSLFYSLINSRSINGTDVKPIVEDIWEIEESMANIFHNHADPIKFITYEGADREYIDNQALSWKKTRPGSTFFGDRKPDIDIIEANAQGKYDSYVSHLNKAMQLGTQFPTDIMTGDFTSRASSETTDLAVDKRVKAFQKYFIQTIMREIYTPLLLINGYTEDSIVKANISISFGTPNVLELLVADVVSLKGIGALTVNEVREWAKENTGLDLFEDDVINQQQLDNQALKQAQMNPDNSNNQTNDSSNLQNTKKEKIKCTLCKENQHALCTKRRCKCKHEVV